MKNTKLCGVLHCNKPVHSHEYCSTHYYRFKKYGDPTIVRPPKPKASCLTEGCGEKARAMGMCIKHYLQEKNTRTKCSISGCGGGVASFGLCNKHYLRQKRHGSTDKVLHHAKQFFENVILKYDGDACLMWPFQWPECDYYPRIKYNGKTVKVHRAVCLEAHGPAPEGKNEVAHSCGNGIQGCCNPKHLRWATHVENMADRYSEQ